MRFWDGEKWRTTEGKIAMLLFSPAPIRNFVGLVVDGEFLGNDFVCGESLFVDSDVGPELDSVAASLDDSCHSYIEVPEEDFNDETEQQARELARKMIKRHVFGVQ